MSTTQEIIVYRNPAEKAMWDLLMDGGSFPFMVTLVAYFIVLVIYFRFLEKRRYTTFKNKIIKKLYYFLLNNIWFGFVVSSIPAYLVFKFLEI